MAIPAHWLGPRVYPRGAPQSHPKQPKRVRCDAATYESVLSNPDLLACILSRVGVSTLVGARAVCRLWRETCTQNEQLLLAVASYAGSLLKREFMGLFRLSSIEADAYPRQRRARARGGHYYLYRFDAFEEVLRNRRRSVGLRAS